jgi:hypothetical protein
LLRATQHPAHFLIQINVLIVLNKLEIAQLRREVIKLKAERDILNLRRDRREVRIHCEAPGAGRPTKCGSASAPIANAPALSRLSITPT